MTDDALLEAILESPDDDAPRLAYAAALEQRGDPRGEFIRIQCTRTRTAELDAREHELLRRYTRKDDPDSWTRGVQVSHGAGFRRGFVVVTDDYHDHPAYIPSVADYLAVAETTARVVLFEQVRLQDREVSDDVWQQLVGHRILRRWRWLDELPALDPARFRALVASPHLCRLERLSISSPIGIDGFATVASAPTMTSLRFLSWIHAGDVDGDAAAELLARSPVLELWSFGSDIRIGDAGLAALAGARVLREVETLGLKLSATASGDGLARLLSSIEGPLRRLVIDGLASIDRCLELLAGTPALAHLTSLDISQSAISDEGLARLLASVGDELEDLSFDGKHLTRTGFEALLASELPSDISLTVANTPMDPDLLARLDERFAGFRDPSEDAEYIADEPITADRRPVDPAHLDAWCAGVRTAVEAIRVLDPKRQIYGARWHRYEFGAPLATDELATLERHVGAPLDPYYRAYVTKLGRTGAGPDNGICDTRTARRNAGYPCLLLTDMGCGAYSYLLALPPHAGEVLGDGRGAGGGMGFVGQTFGDWFDGWLDEISFLAAVTAARADANLTDEQRRAITAILPHVRRFGETGRSNEWSSLIGTLGLSSGRAGLGVVHVALGDLTRASEDLAAAVAAGSRDELVAVLRDRLARSSP